LQILVGKGGHIRTVPIPLWVKRAVDAWTESAQITDGHEVEDHSQFYSIVRLSPGHGPSLHKPTERPKFERYHQGDGLVHRTNVQFYERDSDTGARRIFDDVIRSAAERKPICLPLPLLPAVGERDLRESEHGIHIPAIESFDESHPNLRLIRILFRGEHSLNLDHQIRDYLDCPGERLVTGFPGIEFVYASGEFEAGQSLCVCRCAIHAQSHIDVLARCVCSCICVHKNQLSALPPQKTARQEVEARGPIEDLVHAKIKNTNTISNTLNISN
jgi:hypothetical protein